MSIVKTIGRHGQVTLGKQYAGKRVLVNELEPGVWILKIEEVIPDNERWLHQPQARAKLDRALAWAETTPPAMTDLDELERRILS